jgi:nucleoside-diphosphate-sugar epimerase
VCYISKGLADMIHHEVGTAESEQMYMYFDPKLYATVQFPFRRETFITSPGKAKKLLQWAPKHRLEQDLKEEVKHMK